LGIGIILTPWVSPLGVLGLKKVRFPMKKIVLLLSIVFLLGFTQVGFSAELKIGSVDMEMVFNAYKKTEQLNDKLKAEQEKSEKESEKRIKEIEGLKEEMKLLSESAKEKKQEIIEQKIKDLQEFALKSRNSLLEKRNEMIKEILEDIDKVIQKKVKENNYDLILDNRVLLYKNEDLDLTEEIIKALGK
jgi:outer membrane protein